jgi:hypothetical protein
VSCRGWAERVWGEVGRGVGRGKHSSAYAAAPEVPCRIIVPVFQVGVALLSKWSKPTVHMHCKAAAARAAASSCAQR